MIKALTRLQLQIVVVIDFKTVVTDSKCMCIVNVWINSGQDTHNGSVRIFINAEITKGDSRGSIIAADDGHGHLAIKTTSMVISNSYGISLNQLLTISQGGNSTFINLKVPVDCFVGSVEGRRKGTYIVVRTSSESDGVVVACIDICKGK